MSSNNKGLAAKEAKLQKLYNRIHDIDDEMIHKKFTLNRKKEQDASKRVKSDRINARKSQYNIDSELRPSDRNFNVRTYTKLDIDTWQYEDLREWFNTSADSQGSTQPEYNIANTSYTIKF